MLFKQHCLLCLDTCSNIALCDDCQVTLPWQNNACLSCAIPLESKEHLLCAQCMLCPPYFDQCLSLFSYQAPIIQLIRQLKFRHNFIAGKILGNLWITHLEQTEHLLPDVIIPVPLHYKRLKSRGYNQAVEIAKPIAKHFNLPINTRSCIRIKHAKPQASLPAKKRKRNLKNAFALSDDFEGKHVAIFDDVMTTGSTMHEIAGLLKKQGAKKIEAWSCARVALK